MNKIDISAVDFNLIKTFDALMKTRSVTKAAALLNIGQPAMSHALSRLRETFDDELFVRTSSGMRPTRRANEIAIPVNCAIAEIQRAFRSDIDFDPTIEDFEFTLALSDYSECVLLPTLLADIATSAPAFKLRVIPYAFFSYQRLLDENNVDLAVASVRRTSAVHRHERLFDDQRSCMYSNKLIKAKAPITLDNYLKHRHVIIDRDGHDTTPVDTALADKHGKSRKVGLVTPRFATLPPVLSRAPLIATLPARISYVFAHESDLTISKLPFSVPTIEQSMVWHAAAENNPAFQWLLDRVRAAAATPM